MEDSVSLKSTSNKNEFIYDDGTIPIITDLKFWRNRLKYNTFNKYTFIILLTIQVTVLTIIEVETFFDSLFTNINSIIIYIIVLYLVSKIPKSFQKMILKNQHIFPSKEKYEAYKEYIRKVFSSKLEVYIPLVCALVYVFMSILLYGFARGNFGYMELKSGTRVYFEGLGRVLLIFGLLVTDVFYFLLIVTALSTLFVILFSIFCLDKLGSDKFPLVIDFKDLKVGTLKSFGKWAISIMIPPILLCTALSATGFFYLIIYDAVLVGYFGMITGISIALIVIILLFKITLDLHRTIIYRKAELKKQLDDDLPKDFKKKPINYIELESKARFYDRIDEIENWPFDFNMIRKLFLTFSTSILPLILSLLKQFFF